MNQSSRKLLYIAGVVACLSFSAQAGQIDLNQRLIDALESTESEILLALGLAGQGHTMVSIAYADAQGYASGNIQYPQGYQLVPTPVATLDEWNPICSPSLGVINQSSTQEVQEGSTYENTDTTNASIIVEVDASVNYGAASLDVNTVTSFDTSQTTTTTNTAENMKSVTINLYATREFTCNDNGPFFMHGRGVISNNLTQTLSGSTRVPYTYDVYPIGNIFTVTTKAPFVTNTLPGGNVRVVMYNNKGTTVWDNTNAADPSNPNNFQWYNGNSNFPDKEDIRRVLVSTSANYGVTAKVWICKTNNDCLEMGKDVNYLDKNSRFANGNIHSIIVQNQDSTTTQTGGELTNHTMNISDFLGLQYTIATLGGIYTARAIDNLSSTNTSHIYEYDPTFVPADFLSQCGATLAEAQAAYRSICK